MTQGTRETPFDPVTSRATHRLSTVYATNVDSRHVPASVARPPSSALRLGRLARFYDGATNQLPQVVASEPIDLVSMHFSRWADAIPLSAARLWILKTPSAPIAVAISLHLACDLPDLIPLLEDCYYADFAINGKSFAEYCAMKLAEVGCAGEQVDQLRIEPECHQQVFLQRPEGRHASLPDADELQRLIYRADLDWRPEYSSIRHPLELNRRPTSMAALGPFVSVFYAQQDYIENAAFLSASQVVAASARTRQLRGFTYDALQLVDSVGAQRAAEGTLRQRRLDRGKLARAAERLATAELQLTFGVESAINIDLLIPSLRTNSYHRELCSAIALRESADTVSKMLTRLSTAIHAEATAVQTLVVRQEELRRLRWGVAIGLLTTIALPINLVLTFFGGQASQVHPHTSLFSWKYYGGLYISIVVSAVFAATVFVWLFRRHLRELRELVRGS